MLVFVINGIESSPSEPFTVSKPPDTVSRIVNIN
jgi:hypothetical protein